MYFKPISYFKSLLNKQTKTVTVISPERQNSNFNFVGRSKENPSTWRSAQMHAELHQNSVYTYLIKLYKEINDDSEVFTNINTRFNFLSTREFQILNGETENVKAMELFNKDWFEDFLKHSFLSIFWGYSFIKLGDIDTAKNDIAGVELIDRFLTNPKNKTILETLNQMGESGKSILDEDYKDWIVFASDSQDEDYKGLFNKVAPYFLFLKETFNLYLLYNARFSSPNIVGFTDSTDPEYLKKLEEFLSNFSSASFALGKLTDRIEVIQATGGNPQIFTELIRECKEAISRIILGGNSLGGEKSFVGSSLVNFQIANLYSLNDIKFIEKIVNNELIPRLINLGFTYLNGCKFIINKEDKTVDANKEKEFIIQLLQLGKNIPDSFISEKFGIPIDEKLTPDTDVQPKL